MYGIQIRTYTEKKKIQDTISSKTNFTHETL